jgi:hypothetical protein
MSGVMEEAERFWALGLNSIPEKHLCSRHIDEYAIRNFINRTAEEGTCDYCGRDTKVVELEDLMTFIMETVYSFYSDPAEFMSYNGREGGYLGTLYDANEILQEHFELDIPELALFNDVFGSIDLGKAWADEFDYRDSPADTLKFSWDYFKDVVQHRSRYYFSVTKDLNSIDYKLMPEEILSEIGKNIRRYKLIKTLSAGSSFYRCRQHTRVDLSVNSAEGMTSPPQLYAIQPNRMSPAGISMFYGAFEEETAIVETVQFENKQNKFYTTAIFNTKRELTVIDLSALPKVPSPFDIRKRKHYYPLIFLNNFVRDLAKPLEDKNLVHIDYVPTQIITEYFRFPFSDRLPEGQKIDGIIYPSSRNGKNACVLFFDNEESLEVLDFDASSINRKKI